MEPIKLTQYSHGAGCGCKIAPAVLEKILQGTAAHSFPQLLVGHESNDDAAVIDLGNAQCLISTTDFFMPIVDDAFTFGRIAAANALSDVYAMGGKPVVALAVLGWPVDKIPVEVAREVLAGGRAVCEQAGIPLAGGHSIDSTEPIFGLAVNGLVSKANMKRNNTAQAGALLYLTKPLGVGMIATAQKRGQALPDDVAEAVSLMTTLNTVGAVFGALPYVQAMTDVTGFGLLGHLLEVCRGSGVSATIHYKQVPHLTNIAHYVSHMIYPDNTFRNWSACQQHVAGIGSDSLLTLCDPQTSGGLLVCVDAAHAGEFESIGRDHGLSLNPIGELTEPGDALITVA